MARSPLEVHVTVEGCGPDELLRDLAGIRPQAKLTHIALDEAGERTQLMVTWHQTGSLPEALAAADEVATALAAQGVVTTRRKVEAQFDDASHGEGLYLELHVLVAATDLDRLQAVAQRHEARVSRRAHRDPGLRFVNARWWQPVDTEVASEAGRQLVDDLVTAGFTVADCTAERVLHDSNLALDEGWLTR